QPPADSPGKTQVASSKTQDPDLEQSAADSPGKTQVASSKTQDTEQPPDPSPQSPAEDREPADEPAAAVPTTDYGLRTTEADADAVGVSLSDFSAAWPVIVSRIRTDFGARRHAFVKVAEPRSVEGSVAVLTMPSHQHFHLEQLNADDQLLAALEAIAADVLGSPVTLRFRSDDDKVTSEKKMVVAEPPLRAPEKDDLEEGKDPEDPADMIADMLGGKIIEE
ncbi:MAG: hypothetical protein U9N79_09155, partial [Actinomycetota bacterium]|nr:hypothetical protein [Actinomycetota bacterium]